MKRPANYSSILALLCLALAAIPLAARQGRGGGAGVGSGITMSTGCGSLPDPRGGGNICSGAAPTGRETADYNAFASESYIDKRIQLGEDFEKDYPKSRYLPSVDDALAFLYYNRGNWTKFYATADKVFAQNPNDFAVPRLAGWMIPVQYDPSDPAGPAQLNKAEKYEKRVLALVAAMKKPKDQPDDQFARQKASEESQAHSGLGLTYFRRKDYDDSSKELQIATAEESPQPSPQDLYILAVDLQALNRTDEAVAIFTKCAQVSEELRAQCQTGAKSPAEETAYAALLNEPDAGTRIALGENFEASYPRSDYREAVNIALLRQYQRKQDWPKFYAAANQVIAIDPDNEEILALVSWVISHNYDATSPGASARLDQAAKYAAHALELVPATQQKPDQSADDFDAAKTALTAQAHGALGMIDFLRNDFANSAFELQLATTQSAPPDPQDIYTLGLDLQKLGRSADAFTKCAKLPGPLAAQCKQSATKEPSTK